MKILCFAMLGALQIVAAAESSGGTSNPSADKDKPATILEPYVVTGEPLKLSFGFSITMVRNQSSMRAFSMTVERVAPGTDAERKGLKSQAQIIAIDGKPLSEYEATFNPGSELARIFIGRAERASVTLQIIPFGKQKPQTLRIVRKTILNEFKIGGVPLD